MLPNDTNLSEKKDNMKLFFFGFVGLIVGVLLILLAVGSYRVFSRAATDGFTVAIAKTLRLPVLKVNGDAILYKDYVEDLRAISTMREYDKTHNGSAGALTDEAMSDQVLFRLVNNALVAQAAKKFGITVQEKDVADVKTQILTTQFKDLAEANTALTERYGWNLDAYEIRVIRPFVLQNKLTEYIKNDPAAVEQIKAQAQTVLDQIKAGGDFAALAKQFGADGTAVKGGDLGWFEKGQMVTEFETAAFALKKGELSPTLVQSPFGYHIVRLDDKKVEKTKDEKGKTVLKDMIRASHILFAFPSLEQFLNALAKQADIHLYVKVHDPFKALKEPVVTPVVEPVK